MCICIQTPNPHPHPHNNSNFTPSSSCTFLVNQMYCRDFVLTHQTYTHAHLFFTQTREKERKVTFDRVETKKNKPRSYQLSCCLDQPRLEGATWLCSWSVDEKGRPSFSCTANLSHLHHFSKVLQIKTPKGKVWLPGPVTTGCHSNKKENPCESKYIKFSTTKHHACGNCTPAKKTVEHTKPRRTQTHAPSLTRNSNNHTN